MSIKDFAVHDVPKVVSGLITMAHLKGEPEILHALDLEVRTASNAAKDKW